MGNCCSGERETTGEEKRKGDLEGSVQDALTGNPTAEFHGQEPIQGHKLELLTVAPKLPSANTRIEGAHNFTVGSMNTNAIGRDHITHYHTCTHQPDSSSPNLGALRTEIRAWLKAPSFSAIHRASKELKTEKTGTWFLESNEFKDFVQAKGCVLWCTGKPGSGKTILASTSIEHLQDSIPSNVNMVVAYAYLRYSEQRTLGQILLSLLDQLLALDDAVAKVEPAFRKTKQDGASYTVKELVRVLEDIIGCLSKVYAVIDGLDEASDEVKDGLLQALPPLGINLLIFSRPLKMFTCHTPDAIEVSIQARTEDIALYISEQFEKNARLKALLGGRPDLAEELSNRIRKQADGMFLLARLQLESAMRNATSAKSLFDELEKLPSGVNDMYNLTLERINDQPEGLASLAHRLFVWLAYAEPLPSAVVVQEALAVSVENRTYEELNITPLELILSACHGLVTMAQSNPVWFLPGKQAQFRFIHYTTQEYVRNTQFPAIPHPYSFLTAACVVRMDSHIDILGKKYGQDHTSLDEDKQDTSLADYAYHQWNHHLELSQKAGEDLHPTIFWALARHVLYPLSLDMGTLMTPSLGIAAWYGLVDIIKSKCLDFPIPKSTHFPSLEYPNLSTPFHSASSNLQFDAFMALLSAYEDEVQHAPIWRCSKDNWDSSVIHTALRSSYYWDQEFKESLLSFLQRLLATIDSFAFPDFDINVQDCYGRTPLMVACRYTRLEVIRLLVEHGGDPLMVDSEMNTALLYTMHRRSVYKDSHELTEVMQFFLTHHPHLINQSNINGETALMLAVSRASEPAGIQYLLSQAQLYLRDPEAFSQFINAHDAKGQTALTHIINNSRSRLIDRDMATVHENWKILLTTASINTRITDRLGRSLMENLCTGKYLINLHEDTIDDYLFPMLYALLDVEVGLDAHSIRKAVITGVRDLPAGAVYRLLLEDWVVHSFDWSTDHADTITLLVQAADRASAYATDAQTSSSSGMSTSSLRVSTFQESAPCMAAVRIVLYYLGLLEPSLFPRGVQMSNYKELAQVFCGEVGCDCACSNEYYWGGRKAMGVPRLSTLLERRRSYTPAELERRIRKTPRDQM